MSCLAYKMARGRDPPSGVKAAFDRKFGLLVIDKI